jgi:hypothetical protein
MFVLLFSLFPPNLPFPPRRFPPFSPFHDCGGHCPAVTCPWCGLSVYSSGSKCQLVRQESVSAVPWTGDSRRGLLSLGTGTQRAGSSPALEIGDSRLGLLPLQQGTVSWLYFSPGQDIVGWVYSL